MFESNTFLAAVKKRGLIRDISVGDGEVPLDHTSVMGLLSVTNTMRFPSHVAPQVSAAARIAKSSL